MDEMKDDGNLVQEEKPKKVKTTKKKSIDDKPEAVQTEEKPKKKTASPKKKKVTPKKKKAIKEKIEDSLPESGDINIDPQPTGQAEVSNVNVEVIVNETNEHSFQIDTSEPVVTTVQGGTVASAPQTVQAQVGITQSSTLPLTAIKVRNVVGKIVNLVAEIIPNKVIVQGVLHEQLFFVGNDGIVHHLSEDIHFSAFVDIPGIQTGMNAQVSAIIEEIITELAPDGLSIVKKFIIEIFVKVTETVQVNLPVGNGPVIFLQQVIGENTAQTLIEADVALEVPAIKIDEIVGSIRDLEIEVIKDKVIIQGNLHKQIFFVDTANLGRHQGEDLHFSLFVDVPGAIPGMDVQVQSCIEGIFFQLINATTLRQKAVLQFFVKVTENILQPVTLGNGPLFKVEEFIGENRIQELSDTLITLFRPAIKIREIVAQVRDITTHVIRDKVIVQGTLHKQIFFIGTDNIEYHQAEDIPIAVFLDIPGVAAGDLVHLTTQIEGIFFELVSSTELRQKVIIAINVIVTREVQLNLVIGTGALFKLEQVVGENTTQILLVRTEIIVSPFPPIPVVSEVTIVIPAGIVFGTQQIILTNSIQLPVTAIKIKEINAVVTNISFNVITDGVVVEGEVVKTVSFVGTDNIVRSVTEVIPFSILVNIPGITPTQALEITVNIEDITSTLSADGMTVNQLIVLKAVVQGQSPPVETFTIVTDVSGEGIMQTKIRVIAQILGGEVTEFDAVTNVSGPGILNVTKQLVPLIVVGSGNPEPVPTLVVTNVQVA